MRKLAALLLVVGGLGLAALAFRTSKSAYEVDVARPNGRPAPSDPSDGQHNVPTSAVSAVARAEAALPSPAASDTWSDWPRRIAELRRTTDQGDREPFVVKNAARWSEFEREARHRLGDANGEKFIAIHRDLCVEVQQRESALGLAATTEEYTQLMVGAFTDRNQRVSEELPGVFDRVGKDEQQRQLAIDLLLPWVSACMGDEAYQHAVSLLSSQRPK